MSNAVKYSPKGGLVRVNCMVDSESVQLCISDTGIGMRPEQQSHLSEPLYRANSSNTTLSGTGLGLAITRQIIELHGGKVWVESERDIGTKVRLTLPRPE
jgi:signal transduction histidine kinase